MKKHLMIVAAVAGLSPAVGLAQLVAENDFDLAPGQVHGTTSGFGFTAWDSQNPGLSPLGYRVHTSGLSYAGLRTVGNSVVGGGAFTGSGIGLSIPSVGQPATPWTPFRKQTGSGAMAGAEGTTLWASVLLNQFVETEDFNLSFHDSAIRWAESDRAIKVGVGGGRFTLGEKVPGGVQPPVVSTGVRRIPGQTNLLVFKFDFLSAASDRVTLFVNPTLGAGVSAPNVAGTVLNSTRDVYFRSIQFYPNQNRLTGGMDAIRFGGSFNDVTPRSTSAAAVTQRPNRAYFIGNSVTDAINQENLRQLSLERGNFMPWGRQVIPGSPLEFLWNSPTGGFVNAPYNHPQAAFTNPDWSWDSIILQPFDRQLASDLDYSQRFISLAKTNAANADTQFYVYSRWPRRDANGSLDYQSKWDRAYTGANGTEESRAYFEQVMFGLRDQNPTFGKPILLVPVGDVLYEFDRRAEAGLIPGFTDVVQLYSDGIHFDVLPQFGNVAIGSYLVGLTYYATLFKADPAGLTTNPWGVVDPALDAAIKDLVWDVVSVHPHAGVIPEPGSMGLLAVAAGGLVRRRR